MTNQNREMNLSELDAVSGGSLFNLVKAIGKLFDSSTYTPPATVATNLVKWQKSLK